MRYLIHKNTDTLGRKITEVSIDMMGDPLDRLGYRFGTIRCVAGDAILDDGTVIASIGHHGKAVASAKAWLKRSYNRKASIYK